MNISTPIIPRCQYVVTLSPQNLDEVAAQLEKRHSLAGRISAAAWGFFCGSPIRAAATTTALSLTAQPLLDSSFYVIFPAMLTICSVTWYNNPSFVSLGSSREHLQELKKLLEKEDIKAFWNYAFAHKLEELLIIPMFALSFILQIFLNHLYAGDAEKLSEVAGRALKVIEKIPNKTEAFQKWEKLLRLAKEDPEVLLLASGEEKIEDTMPARELLDLVGPLISS